MSVSVGSVTEPSVRHVSQEKLKGLGGWLVIVGIGQVLGPIRTLMFMGQYYSDSATDAAFQRAPLALEGELALNVAYAGLVLFTSYAFFAQKRYFRLLFVLEVTCGPILVILDGLWISVMASVSLSAVLDAGELLQSILVCIPGAVWIVYTYRSKRALNTFVR